MKLFYLFFCHVRSRELVRSLVIVITSASAVCILFLNINVNLHCICLNVCWLNIYFKKIAFRRNYMLLFWKEAKNKKTSSIRSDLQVPYNALHINNLELKISSVCLFNSFSSSLLLPRKLKLNSERQLSEDGKGQRARNLYSTLSALGCLPVYLETVSDLLFSGLTAKELVPVKHWIRMRLFRSHKQLCEACHPIVRAKKICEPFSNPKL